MATLRTIHDSDKRETTLQVLDGYEIRDYLKEAGYHFATNSVGEKLWYKVVGDSFALGYTCELEKLGVKWA